MHRLWIDKRGWCLLDGDEEGCWVADPWLETAVLLEKLPLTEPMFLALSPEFFVYFNASLRPGITPMEHAREKLGLRPGKWFFQTAVTDETLHLACYPAELEGALESLAARWPDRLRIVFAPIEQPALATTRTTLDLGDRTFLCAFDNHGHLQQWHWLPEEVATTLSGLRQEAGPWLAQNDSISWLVYRGRAITTYATLGRLNGLLARAILVVAAIAAICWAGRLMRETGYAAAYASASQFLTENQLEAEEIDRLQQSGEQTFRELREIQAFSNRDNPIANQMARLANLGDRHSTWRELSFDDGRFALTLAGENLDRILDLVDRVRAQPDIDDLRFEELDRRGRDGHAVVRIEGRFL